MAGLTKFVSQKPENITEFKHVELTNKAEMSNDIGEGEIRLLGEEYNLVCVLLSAINKNAEQFEDCSISMKSVIDKMDGYGGSASYTRIRKLIDKMMSAGHDKIKFAGIGVKGWISWFDYIAYSTFEDDNESKIYYKFHNKLAPSLLKLGQRTPEGSFVGFLVLKNLDEMISFKGMYTNRIYTWIVKSAKIGRVRYSVDDIVRMLGGEIKESYVKKTSDLKRRIIEPSVKEINEKSDKYEVTLIDIKDARKIIGFEFLIKIREKHKNRDNTAIDAEIISDTEAEDIKAILSLADRVVKYGVTKNQIEEYANKFGLELLTDTVEYSLAQGSRIENFGGFLYDALKKGTAKGWKAQQEKVAADSKAKEVYVIENNVSSDESMYNSKLWTYFLGLAKEEQQQILDKAISESQGFANSILKAATIEEVIDDDKMKYRTFMYVAIERHMKK